MSRYDEPAFPKIATGDGENYTDGYVYTIQQGLSKRELIAAILMIGLPGRDVANTVEIAIQHADALLAELEKPR